MTPAPDPVYREPARQLLDAQLAAVADDLRSAALRAAEAAQNAARGLGRDREAERLRTALSASQGP